MKIMFLFCLRNEFIVSIIRLTNRALAELGQVKLENLMQILGE